MSDSSSPLGNCVVCGARTATRCGPCAANGTDWMFFCSREHQKLVWYMHKRVCGKRSRPFTWPGFTEKEIERVVESAKKPSFDQERKCVTTWIEEEGEREGWPAHQREAMFEKRIRGAQDDQPDEIVVSWKVQSEIVLLRTAFFLHELSRATRVERKLLGEALQVLAPRYPIDFHIYQQTQELFPLPDLSFDRSLLPDWCRFQHKAIIIHAIDVGIVTDRTAEALRCSAYARGEIRRYCREEIAITHPGDAAAMAAAW